MQKKPSKGIKFRADILDGDSYGSRSGTSVASSQRPRQGGTPGSVSSEMKACEMLNFLEGLAEWIRYRVSMRDITPNVQDMLLDSENLLRSIRAACEISHYEAAVNMAVSALSLYDEIWRILRGEDPLSIKDKPQRAAYAANPVKSTSEYFTETEWNLLEPMGFAGSLK
ncbi:hypothetical protein APY94_01590 [Thermococcus celericrescens]|uniref:Uncharacterized protein n=1 Tax=Thermococcus celericrescens TaxID=227598 RepID=A0A100XZH3_9EURY|nr:hypothetical protein [Thermococcus celericrescens]KUH34537.1 hypothetical protein APY94_01590 [Thermococcus celericrescens]